MANKQMAMVIDLQRCAGCGACALACKTENNTQMRARGQTFNWADFVYKTEGTFPNVKFTAIPVRCNHCSEPACVKPCPEPKALYKSEEGLTLYNAKYCIQCKKCQDECPYSARDIDKEGDAYSIISFNDVGKDTHEFYKDKTELITGCTSSPAEVAGKSGGVPPYKNAYKYKDTTAPQNPKESKGKGEVIDVRKDGWVEKCHFCVHRIREGLKPYCVESCPADARIVGDINDPNSEVSQLIKKYKPMRLKDNKGEFLKDGEDGTKPNVYYIRSFKAEAKVA
ncbi:MAG: 4Fe-4S dicluster domain-containing protein [Candidatus Roizmanbacteria bacterium]|nr:4Fe-4S dicluster domain-containing protein [Candidatus Roizmanbacteria bacterium]